MRAATTQTTVASGRGKLNALSELGDAYLLAVSPENLGWRDFFLERHQVPNETTVETAYTFNYFRKL